MNDSFEMAAERVAAFQKMWTETMSKAALAAFTAGTAKAPAPESLRQVRAGILQVLAASWEEFMRSPQFLESMRQSLDNTVRLRQMSNDFLARVRKETQSPSRYDVESLGMMVHHLERRLLDEIEELSAQVTALNQKLDAAGNGRATAARAGRAKSSAPKRRARAAKSKP
jgi:hypothetical protein